MIPVGLLGLPRFEVQGLHLDSFPFAVSLVLVTPFCICLTTGALARDHRNAGEIVSLFQVRTMDSAGSARFKCTHLLVRFECVLQPAVSRFVGWIAQNRLNAVDESRVARWSRRQDSSKILSDRPIIGLEFQRSRVFVNSAFDLAFTEKNRPHIVVGFGVSRF